MVPHHHCLISPIRSWQKLGILGGKKGMYSLPKHKVKWAFYLSRPLWNGSIPRICELTRIWSIIRLDQRNLSPRKVGIDSFMTPERVTERQDLHPGPPGLLPFILYPRPRSSHCFADHITFCFMLYIFFPFYYHSTLFFHLCPSIITHSSVYYISKLKLFPESTSCCQENHK